MISKVDIRAFYEAIGMKLHEVITYEEIQANAARAVRNHYGPKKQNRQRREPVVNSPSVSTKEEFYKSWEWRTLRMEAIQKHGRSCQCCGSAPGQKDASGAPVRICVDHIKPISKHWHLRLDLSNLQILCDECNQGKGNWSETDFRPAPVADEWVIDEVGVPDDILSQLTDRTTGRLQ
jgi:5-methylcytosine-specific restriction endonuclease McrA